MRGTGLTRRPRRAGNEPAELLALQLTQSFTDHQELISRARVALSEGREVTTALLLKRIERDSAANETAFRSLFERA